MTVASNGLPDHCYASGNTHYPVGSDSSFNAYVWRFTFNVNYKDMTAFTGHAVNTPYVFTSLTTQNEVDFS